MSYKPVTINDPIYGPIVIEDAIVMRVIGTHYFQRLRRVQQMSVSHLTYPGTMHTRFQHSIGAYYLMTVALRQLQQKGVDISKEEFVGAQLAILLHDVGHGPFSHTLEGLIIKGVKHEEISLGIMMILNRELGGGLELAIKIFKNEYGRKFLHQLVSSQLDVDRLDYLTRDSFYSGVAEGVIGYDRIISLMNVVNDELVLERKGVYTIERFLFSRAIMYWQVYYHKTVWATEQLIKNIFERIRELYVLGKLSILKDSNMSFFLGRVFDMNDEGHVNVFSRLDDVDVLYVIKMGAVQKEDVVLYLLCDAFINRKLYKVNVFSEEKDVVVVNEGIKKNIVESLNVDENDLKYFVIEKKISNYVYDNAKDKINFLVYKHNQPCVEELLSLPTLLLNGSENLLQTKYYQGFWRI